MPTAKKSASPKTGKSTSGSSKTSARSSAAKASARSSAKKSTAAKSASSRSKAGRSTSSKAKPAQSKSKSTSTTTKAKASPSNRKASSSRKGSSSSKRSSGANSKGIVASAIDAVAGIFKEGAPDAIDLLKTDHRKVEDLFAKVKENEDGNNASTFKKIKEELDVHAHIEETIFYPHLLDKGDKELKKIVREGLEEHTQVKVLLAELADLSGDSATFKAKITVLMENVEHHVEEEEDEMFSMVQDQIPADTLQRLGSLMQGEKVKVKRMKPSSRGKAKAAGASKR